MDKTKPALVLPITVTLGESAVTKDTIEALPPIRFIGDTADRLLQACRRERLLKGQFTLHVRTIGSFGFSGTTVLQAAFNRAHKEGLLLCEPELVVRLLQAPGMIVRPGRAAVFAMKTHRTERYFQLQGIQQKTGVERLLRLLPGDPYMECTRSMELVFASQFL